MPPRIGSFNQPNLAEAMVASRRTSEDSRNARRNALLQGILGGVGAATDIGGLVAGLTEGAANRASREALAREARNLQMGLSTDQLNVQQQIASQAEQGRSARSLRELEAGQIEGERERENARKLAILGIEGESRHIGERGDIERALLGMRLSDSELDRALRFKLGRLDARTRRAIADADIMGRLDLQNVIGGQQRELQESEQRFKESKLFPQQQSLADKEIQGRTVNVFERARDAAEAEALLNDPLLSPPERAEAAEAEGPTYAERGRDALNAYLQSQGTTPEQFFEEELRLTGGELPRVNEVDALIDAVVKMQELGYTPGVNRLDLSRMRQFQFPVTDLEAQIEQLQKDIDTRERQTPTFRMPTAGMAGPQGRGGIAPAVRKKKLEDMLRMQEARKRGLSAILNNIGTLETGAIDSILSPQDIEDLKAAGVIPR